MKDVWKEYEQTEPSHSTVHHLMAIDSLLREHGYARGIDIAKHLNISRGSVSTTLSKLKEKGYVAEDQNRFYRLSHNGIKVVNSVLAKRRLLEDFFKDVLKLPYEIASADVCKIEHLLSPETMHRLMCFMGYHFSNAQVPTDFREGFGGFYRVCDSLTKCDLCDRNCFYSKDTKAHAWKDAFSLTDEEEDRPKATGRRQEQSESSRPGKPVGRP